MITEQNFYSKSDNVDELNNKTHNISSVESNLKKRKNNFEQSKKTIEILVVSMVNKF